MMPYYPPRYLFRRHALLRRLQHGNTFLEIGPGNLLLAQELLRYFSSGTLIEYSDDVTMLYNRLPEGTHTRLRLIVADFMEYELAEQYKCVVACEVLEHVVDDGAFLRKLFAAVQNGGQLILSVPALMRFWSPHDEIVGHVRRYEKAALRDLLYQVGFTNVRIDAYGYPFVNWLRIPRIWLATKQHTEKSSLSLTEQTKESGIAQTAKFSSMLGWLVNPITIYPFAQFATLFHESDRSGAYLITADKPVNEDDVQF